MDLDVLTIGFARRATGYKRAELIFSDMDSIRKDRHQDSVRLCRESPSQDKPGKELIEKFFAIKER